MKQSFSGDREVKPSRLIGMTDNIALQIPEVPPGLIEKRVSVPRCRAEIPEVGNYEKKDPEQEECCFAV